MENNFFDTHYPIDGHPETNPDGVFMAGDGVGKGPGLVSACISGMLAAEDLSRKHFPNHLP